MQINSEKSYKQLLHKITDLETKLIKNKNLEKRLKASNQQIQATEQQLRAINQQLIANNQQLQASEKNLTIEKEFSQKLLETANTILVVLDPNANITLFNKFAETITGYKKNEVLHKNWLDIFIPQKIKTEIPIIFSSILENQKQYSTNENAILCKDGSEKNILWQNTVLRNSDNNILGILSIGTDLTEQKATQQKLTQSEHQLQTLIDTMPDYVCFKDAEGRWLKINKASEEIFQLKNINFVGKQDSELAKVNKHLAGTFLTCKDSDALVWQNNSALKSEEKIIDKAGITQIFDVTKIPVYTDSHKRKGLVVLGHNITKQREAEKKFLDRNEILNRLISNYPGITYILDKEGNYLLNEGKGLNTLGLEPNQLVKEKTNAFKLYKDNLELITALQNALKGKVTYLTTYANNKYWNLWFGPYKNEQGEIIGMLGNARDTSKQFLAENALEESEKNVRDILDNSKIQVWSFNGLTYTYLNKEWYDYTGQDRSLTLNINRWIEYVHPDDIAPSGKIWRENWETKTAHKNYFRLKRKDGVYRYFYCYAVPIFHTDGNFKHFQGYNIDITERREAEKKLIKRLEELEIFNDAAVNRELKIISLKQEINSLHKKLKIDTKYEIPK